MAQTNDIIIRLQAKGVDETAKQIKMLEKQLEGMKKGTTASFTQMKKHGDGMKMTTITAKKMGNGMIELSSNFKTTTNNVKKFKMEYLSLMFFSMNASRVLQKTIMSSIQSFQKIAGANNEANQALAAYGAQMNFMRFTLGRAIGEVFAPLLPIFREIVQWAVDFVDEHPEETVWGLVGAFVAFKGLNILSQLALLGGSIAIITQNLGGAKAALAAFGKVAAIGISIVFIYEGWRLIKEGMNEGDWRKVIKGIGGFVAAGAILGFTFGGPYGAAIGATIGLSLGVIVSIFYQKKKEGKSTKRAISEILFPELTSGNVIGIGGPFPIGVGLDDIAAGFKNLAKTGETELNKITSLTGILGFLLGSSKKGSFPIVYSLIQIENEWMVMSEIAITQIKMIITNLNNIPRTIVTTHIIRTVREGKGFATGTAYVPQTGTYTLHQGERVIPRGQVTMGNINVNAQTNANPNDIANQIQRVLDENLRRYL